MKTKFLFLGMASLLSGATGLMASNYAVDWDVQVSGAGSSSGGSYAVWDVLGQADAGDLTGGTFAVSTGQMSQPGLAGFQTRVATGGRRLFYNNTKFDSDNAAANSSDDNAIATDKTALLPGQTATFANVSSLGTGITGVMIDVEALPDTVTDSDIEVRTGNSSNFSSWTALAKPGVTVRRGAGVGGSDRITLIFPGSSIRNRWLEVKLLTTPQTGLPSDDVFYFGSSVGDTGDSTSHFYVNSTDVLRIRRGLVFGFQPVTTPYDFNRDKLINSMDVLLARRNLTTVLSQALVKLQVP